MMALDLDTLSRGRRVAPWLHRFAAEPIEALHELLLGGAALGHLDPAEPELLLLDWMEGYGEPMVGSLDAALAGWFERHWGQPILPGSFDSAELTARAWRRSFDIVAGEPRLERAPAVLRNVMPRERHFLAAMTEGRSRDTEGRAWIALARHQRDRSLLEQWWRLCRLPPEAPWWYGGYGILGLRYLPEEQPGTGGGFPQHVADGLVHFAEALDSRVEEGWLQEERAREEFLAVARRAVWASNYADRWCSFWRQQLPAEGEGELRVDGWIRQLFPEQLENFTGQLRQRRRVLHPAPDSSWADRAKEIRLALRRQEQQAVEKARALLREQRDYADATGDSYFVVRSAVDFAGQLLRWSSGQALEWARLGHQYDPRNAHAWTTETAVLLELKRLDEAARIAFEAVRRFPYDAGAHTILGKVLKAQRRLREAEWIYRDTVRRFPDNARARSGWAELLWALGRFSEAEQLYRDAVGQFPGDRVARCGLADFLVAVGEIEEAEKLYREVLEANPGDRAARSGLEKVDRARSEGLVSELREPAAPEYDASSTPGLENGNVEILLQDAYLLRRWDQGLDPEVRRQRAREILDRLATDAEGRAEVAGEVGLLGLDVGETDRALGLLRLAVERFPGNAKVLYALARAETLATRDDAARDPRRLWRRLTRLDGRLRPLQLLGEARLVVAREEDLSPARVLDPLGELGKWLRTTLDHAASVPGQSEEETPFHVLWARDLERNLYGLGAATDADGIGDPEALCDRLSQNEREIAEAEEIYIDRLAT